MLTYSLTHETPLPYKLTSQTTIIQLHDCFPHRGARKKGHLWLKFNLPNNQTGNDKSNPAQRRCWFLKILVSVFLFVSVSMQHRRLGMSPSRPNVLPELSKLGRVGQHLTGFEWHNPRDSREGSSSTWTIEHNRYAQNITHDVIRRGYCVCRARKY